MVARHIVQVTAAAVLLLIAPGLASAERHRALQATVDALLGLDVRPFAIAHRGYGENLGGDRSRPIENTVAAVRKGFKAGLSVVEVDVQITEDRHVVAYHDDVLPDRTCLNRLTLAEVRARLPHVPTLQAVLDEARRFNQPARPLRGLVIVELKAPAPLCDPDDRREHFTVSAVTRVVRHMRMTDQVLLTSFSPALLDLARHHAPEIERVLAVSGLQFLSKEKIERALHTTVTLIDKRHDVGLQWAEIGTTFRLPGYRSFRELLETALITEARVVEADLLLLHTTGAGLVDFLHAAGLKVFGFTANNEREWAFLESLGVDGIYTNDIPLGRDQQALIP